VKRREVIAILQNLRANAPPLQAPEKDDARWLAEIVAGVCGRPASGIHAATTFDELGFDSLMYTELGTALDSTGIPISSLQGLSSIANIEELSAFLRSSAALPAKQITSAAAHRKESAGEKEVRVPSLFRDAGSKGLDLAHQYFYKYWMDTEIKGSANIPCHTTFIVASNHCSHLDMGLVKFALGDAGKNMVAVAAADYFFDNKYKKAFFENFTNLIPMERKGSLHESLKLANQFLDQGFNLLIFPEGTRSTTGQIAEFKFSLGYLALRSKRGILPLFLDGTFQAMPKGKSIPKRSRKISARIGPFLPYEALSKVTDGIPKNEAYRLVTMLTQKIVEQMRDGKQPVLDWEAIRRQWRQDQKPQIEPSPVK